MVYAKSQESTVVTIAFAKGLGLAQAANLNNLNPFTKNLGLIEDNLYGDTKSWSKGSVLPPQE